MWSSADGSEGNPRSPDVGKDRLDCHNLWLIDQQPQHATAGGQRSNLSGRLRVYLLVDECAQFMTGPCSTPKAPYSASTNLTADATIERSVASKSRSAATTSIASINPLVCSRRYGDLPNPFLDFVEKLT